jgi:hypothetical protein
MKEMRVIKTIDLFIGNLLLLPPRDRQAFPFPHREEGWGICFNIKDTKGVNLVPPKILFFY